MKTNNAKLVLDNKEYFLFREHRSLYFWTGKQRKLLKENALSQNQIDKLNSIGFIWNRQKSQWDKNFEKLIIFTKKDSNWDKALTEQEIISLETWTKTQRQFFKDNKMPQERIDKLNSIGFVWNTDED